MYTFLAIVYVLVCAFLITVVLLQSGKGGGLGSAFGGGGSQTVFGGAGAGNFLTRLTSAAAALFMILSATLAYLSSGSEQSLERAAREAAAKEEARSGAVDGEAPETPEPAGMSVADEAEDEGAADGEAAGDGDAAGEAGSEDAPGDAAPAGDAEGAAGGDDASADEAPAGAAAPAEG